MLQNAYLIAKIGADTAENERNFAKNWQLPYGSTGEARRLEARGAARPGGRRDPEPQLALARQSPPARPIGKISAKFSSFSAVSAPIFASKNIPALRAKQGYTQRRAAPS